jgi:hypothetical protein
MLVEDGVNGGSSLGRCVQTLNPERRPRFPTSGFSNSRNGSKASVQDLATRARGGGDA